MEDQNSQTPVSQSKDEVQSTSPTKKSSLKNLIIVSLVLAIIILVIYILFFKCIGICNDKTPDSGQEGPSITDDVLITTTIEDQTTGVDESYKPTIPVDWSQETFASCDVKFPVPPKKEPYLKLQHGMEYYWSFYSITENIFFWGYQFQNLGLVDYNSDMRLGSGYVQSNVSVKCSANTKKYDSIGWTNYLIGIIKNMKEYMGEPIECNPTTISKSMWGKTIIEVNRNCRDSNGVNLFGSGETGADFLYVFANPQKIYLIYKLADNKEQLFQDTTNIIFNNLEFTD